MVPHSLVELISWIAVSAGTLSVWAQFRRVNVQGIEGVSLATWLMFLLIGGFWIAYGDLSAHSFAIVCGSLLAWPLQASIVFRLKPWEHWRGASQATALFLATCVAPGVIGGWAWCVYGCGLAMTLLRVPQFLDLLRTRDASGVSSASWFISSGTAFLWIAYYSQVGLWGPLIATACSGSASVLIGSMAVWRHRQEKEEFIRREVFAT